MKRVGVMELVKNLLLAGAMVLTGVIFMIPGLWDSGVWLQVMIWAFTVIGAYMMVHYFVNGKELHRNNSLVLGILLLVAGAFMLLFEWYEFVLYFYPLFLAAAGAFALGDALCLKAKGCKAWWQSLILAGVQLVFALLYILLWRFAEVDLLLLLGLELILNGIYLCVSQFVFKHKCERAEVEETEVDEVEETEEVEKAE